MTRSQSEDRQQKAESEMLEAQLVKIERAERRRLLGFGFTASDLSNLGALLTLEEGSPTFDVKLPRTTREKRAADRANHSILTLIYVSQVRRFVQEDNPRRAAYAALHVGALAGNVEIDAAVNRLLGRAQAEGGRSKAAATKAEVDKEYGLWQRTAESIRNRNLSKLSRARMVKHQLNSSASIETIRKHLK
jgi:hypothetical protein